MERPGKSPDLTSLSGLERHKKDECVRPVLLSLILCAAYYQWLLLKPSHNLLIIWVLF